MELKDKVQYAMDEGRMLILGVQVLLGFDFQGFLTKAYEALPASGRACELASLAALLVTMAILFAPVARHRLVDDGKDTPRLHAFTRKTTAAALLPFAIGLACDAYVLGLRAFGATLGVVLASAIGVAALAAWYALPWFWKDDAARHRKDDAMEKTELKDKVRHVLTEARVVLPGTQALLGFQLAGSLQDGFEKLPQASKVLHVVALVALAASMILLMLPAAYHRLAEAGEVTERLHRFSSVCVMAALAVLSVAIGADTFVVVHRAGAPIAAAAIAAVAWLVFSLGAWFGAMLVLRARRHREGASPLRVREAWRVTDA